MFEFFDLACYLLKPPNGGDGIPDTPVIELSHGKVNRSSNQTTIP